MRNAQHGGKFESARAGSAGLAFDQAALLGLDRVFLKLYMYEDRCDIEWLVSDMAGRSGSGTTEDYPHRVTATLDWFRRNG